MNVKEFSTTALLFLSCKEKIMKRRAFFFFFFPFVWSERTTISPQSFALGSPVRMLVKLVSFAFSHETFSTKAQV